MIEIYTDGAYNPGLEEGGWAAIILKDGQKLDFSGAAKNTTSNRMEITAALEGITRMPPGTEITLYTDSQYLFGCMTKGWQRRANRDLWEKLDEVAAKREVTWKWISRNTDIQHHREAHNLATNLSGKVEKPPPRLPAKDEAQAPPAEQLTHLDESGRPRMVDITGKPDTVREAVARGRVRMQTTTIDLIKKGAMAKGDVLTAAQLAGIMATKQTANLIPLCHPLSLDNVKIELVIDEDNGTVEITATAKSTGKTGVEMEALTGTAVAALTIYDMCKAVDRGIQIENIRLVRKSGGKSGTIDLGS